MSRSLHEHAIRRDQLAPKAVDGQAYKWQHRIAALVHGWTLHEHHYADHPIMLSDDDYDKALELAASGSVEAHEPAKARPPEPSPEEYLAPEPVAEPAPEAERMASADDEDEEPASAEVEVL